ncbi:hypothetical protein ACIGN6_17970 [Streptomyces sp. NPDC053792]|uniref:hypothetical protein n=1 Tax=Streptomyces sp. NPDC053792 TaxID=3365716 RepID=UPI0037D4F765
MGAVVGDVPEAVELAADLAPDVVVRDIRMPGVNGIEAAWLSRGDALIAPSVTRVYEAGLASTSG